MTNLQLLRPEKPSGALIKNTLEDKAAYDIGGTRFIVERIFPENSRNTIGTLLVRLMELDDESA